jgi:tight adherence protein B
VTGLLAAVLALVLVLAALLTLTPPRGAARRLRHAAKGGRAGSLELHSRARSIGGASARGVSLPGALRVHRAGKGVAGISMTVVVQQLAALLKGGRSPARLWDELWLVHTSGPDDPSPRTERAKPFVAGRSGLGLSAGSVTVLGAARAAAFLGSPVSGAIRSSAPAAFPRMEGREPRIWFELAACFDIAEASGCPLAEVLTRFATQLEVEDDAEAARQTALAGPKATVTLLTWLPLMGLGLGIALGVDPLAILVGTPLGMAAFAAGVALTVAGRIWSARLVRSAAGAALP